MVYTPLTKLNIILNYPRGQWDTRLKKVANIDDIISLVGIWEAEESKNVYILRKHPGLAMLQDDECGIVDDNDEIDTSGEQGEVN